MQTRLGALDVKGKRVLVREDFNVPLSQGGISDASRIDAALPTIRMLLDKGAQIILMSHLGRPNEGEFDAQYSLLPVANYLQEKLHRRVVLFGLDSPVQLAEDEIGLLENVRFYEGEKANTEALSKQFASLADIFVMDAFAVSHRAQASTVGVARFAKQSVMGPLLEHELANIQRGLEKAASPCVAVVGGSKVSTKLDALNNLLDKVDTLVLGGGIANTFLAALGVNVQASLVETDLIPTAKNILAKAKALGKTIWLPQDVVVAQEVSESSHAKVKELNALAPQDKILDIGPKSCEAITQLIHQAKTVLWNGPLGVFELSPFRQGTKTLSEAIAKSHAFSIAGGGDTIAAINMFDVANDISYISTGGGAFLTLLEGKVLPAVEAL